MWRRAKTHGNAEPAVKGLLIAVVFITMLSLLLLWGIAGTGEPRQQVYVPPVAPTVPEYQAETRAVLTPFLEQAMRMDADDLGVGGEHLAQLVQMTRERMFAVRVPGSERDAHLSFVLLLDRWERSIAGSAEDREATLSKTIDIVGLYPWAYDGPVGDAGPASTEGGL